MDENIQKEMMFASGALVAFVAFLIYGGISEISEIDFSNNKILIKKFNEKFEK